MKRTRRRVMSGTGGKPKVHSYLTVTYKPTVTSADTVFYSSNFDVTQLVSMEIDGVDAPLLPTSKRFTSTGTTCTVRYGFHKNLTNCAHLFESARTITNVDVTEWDSSKVTDMSYMFASAGTSMVLTPSDWNTSIVTNMSHMFDNSSLKTTNFTGFNVSNVTDMSNMFNNAWGSNHVSVNFSGWNTSKVTNMCSMFDLTSLSASTGFNTWNVGNVTDMSYMFRGAVGNRTNDLNLTGWNTSKVTNMKGMFNFCKYLQKLSGLTEWDVSNVTDMSYMFFHVSSASTIGDLSNWNVGKVTDMSNMFAGCSNLTTIGDLSNWKTSSVENIEYLFSQTKFTDLSFVIDKWDLSKVTKIAGLFDGCTSLTNVGSFATTFASKYDTTKLQSLNHLFNSCSNLTSVGDFSLWSTPLVTNYSYMFNNCSGLTSIGSISNLTLSPSGSYTPVTNIAYMFNNCKNLDDVGQIGNWNGSQNTNAEYAFANCYQFTNLGKFTNWHTSGTLTSIAHMFENCPAVDDYLLGDLTNWNTSSVTDMSYFIACNIDKALEGGMANSGPNCSGIGDIGQWDTRNVTNMAYMLAGHNNFNSSNRSGDYPPRITSFAKWNTSKVKNMTGLFMCDISLISSDDVASNGIPTLFNSLSGWTTSAVTDMSYMFYATLYDAPSASTSYFEVFKNWNVKKVTNMAYMFKGCHGMNFTQPFDYWTSQLSGVTNMHGMFMNMATDKENTSNINITLNKFANKTADLGSLFEGRQSLTGATVILGKGTTADTQVTNIENMFNGCNNLSSIKMKIPINTDNVTRITGVASSGTFYYPVGQSELYNTICPSGWTMSSYS